MTEDFDPMAEPDISVTVLTGFLGAGKTTLLNRILKENHGRKIAVIENELGEQTIDNDLLVQDGAEQIVTMNNGCICCTIRGDLSHSARQRRDRFRSCRYRNDGRSQSRTRLPNIFHG